MIQLPAANGTITNGSYNVVVGAGGAGTPGATNGNVGGNSSFGPSGTINASTHLVSFGWWCWLSYPGHTGTNNGGSGGGMGGEPGGLTGSSVGQPAPTVYGTTTGHGNPGDTGTNWSNDHRLGGGGGGAGGPGVAGGEPAPQTGNGGVGLQVAIAGNANNNYYYAGGGGGGIWGQNGGLGNHPSRHGGDGGQGGGGGGSASQILVLPLVLMVAVVKEALVDCMMVEMVLVDI